MPAPAFSVGVEEEYQLIDPRTRTLKPRISRVLPDAQREAGIHVAGELFQAQIEIGTPICHTLEDVRRELKRLRRTVIEAAQRDGDLIAAAGAHPFAEPDEQPITDKERYKEIERNYQQIARDNFICGCHVHIGIGDRELAIQLLNRARGWVSPLLALTANSPYWAGRDTGYASFRHEMWRRWPMAGSPYPFASRAEYDALVRALIQTGSIEDETRIYWDIRPADRYDTLEFRATDVGLSLDDGVMIAGLARSLLRTCYATIQLDEEREAVFVPVRPELLRAAEWRAARYGLNETLVDVHTARSLPAREMMEVLLDFLRDDLEAHHEWEEVSALVWQTLERGNGAHRQRAAYQTHGRLEDVVDFIVEETARDVF